MGGGSHTPSAPTLHPLSAHHVFKSLIHVLPPVHLTSAIPAVSGLVTTRSTLRLTFAFRPGSRSVRSLTSSYCCSCHTSSAVWRVRPAGGVRSRRRV